MYNQSMQDFQRGLSEAQNGYGFGMIPGHGPHDGYLDSFSQHLSLKGARQKDHA